MNKTVYNDVIYNVSQAGLNKITPSILSISFSIGKRNDIKVLIHVLKNFENFEKKIIIDLKKAILKRLHKYFINVIVEEISTEQFLYGNYETLDYVSFLKNYD